MKSSRACVALAFAVVACLPASFALARQTLTVNAQDNIYGAGRKKAPGGGNVPTAILRLSGSPACVEVKKVTGSLACFKRSGCITRNDTDSIYLNDPDGAGHGAPPSSSNTGTAEVSGIKAPLAGYLTALFTVHKRPTGAAPPALDFTVIGTNFTAFSPALDQTFFVGDGHTGDLRGNVQQFNVPSGARHLYFGISDACNDNGPPSCYYDNAGSYTVHVRVLKEACPGS
jgi:hypothetical protein